MLAVGAYSFQFSGLPDALWGSSSSPRETKLCPPSSAAQAGCGGSQQGSQRFFLELPGLATSSPRWAFTRGCSAPPTTSHSYPPGSPSPLTGLGTPRGHGKTSYSETIWDVDTELSTVCTFVQREHLPMGRSPGPAAPLLTMHIRRPFPRTRRRSRSGEILGARGAPCWATTGGPLPLTSLRELPSAHQARPVLPGLACQPPADLIFRSAPGPQHPQPLPPFPSFGSLPSKSVFVLYCRLVH